MPKTYKNSRQQALEEFLNDSVEKLAVGLFKWHGRYYEVVPHHYTLRRHNWSQFVTISGGFRMREASEEIIKKYYPKVTIDK